MKKILFSCALIFSMNVSAGSLVCSGTVDTVAYHGNDKLMVKLSSMNTPVFFCNPNEAWSVLGEPARVMNPETCKSVFSMFLSARATREKISKVTFDGDNVPTSCSGFSTYQNIFIRFVIY
jgi:hypothetical protein